MAITKRDIEELKELLDKTKAFEKILPRLRKILERYIKEQKTAA